MQMSGYTNVGSILGRSGLKVPGQGAWPEVRRDWPQAVCLARHWRRRNWGSLGKPADIWPRGEYRWGPRILIDIFENSRHSLPTQHSLQELEDLPCRPVPSHSQFPVDGHVVLVRLVDGPGLPPGFTELPGQDL